MNSTNALLVSSTGSSPASSLFSGEILLGHSYGTGSAVRAAVAERRRIRGIFQKRCRAQSLDQLLLTEPGYTFSLQETMQNGFVFAGDCRGLSSGQRQDEAGMWRTEVEDCLEAFGI